MAGDFSRKTFDPEKKYTAVLIEQGRLVTDADLNEQAAINLHRTEIEAIDVIGECGVPKGANGFEIELTPDGTDLTISPGRIYVDGLMCELNATPVPVSFPGALRPNQAVVAGLIADELRFASGQWVELFDAALTKRQTIRILFVNETNRLLQFDTDISAFRSLTSPAIRRVTTYLTQPDYPNPEHAVAGSPPASPPGSEMLTLDDGEYLAYLKVWQEEVTYLDDPRIREVALGGPDTSVRLRTVWQVRLLKVTPLGSPPGSPPACSDAFSEWATVTAPSTGRLNVRAASIDKTKPCSIPPKSGFRGLENQLYRVEIHTGGDLSTATFKWSRDNATVTTKIKVNGNTIVAESLGKDKNLGFNGGEWVEIIDPESELKLTPHDLFQIDAPDPASREITTTATISGFSNEPGLKLRRWDQTDSSATKNGVPITPGWMDLEDGIQVIFTAGLYRAGDYWLIPARTVTGDVEWPPFEVPNINPLPQLPFGIRRHYCRLALFSVVSRAIVPPPADCRDLFPPLTAITASDVSYNPGCAELSGTKTVQQALDALCQTQQGICTFIAVPGQNVQTVFDRINPQADAEICFPAGTYVIDKTVVVERKGNLKVTGIGSGTRFVAAKLPVAILFRNCVSVSVYDIFAETGVATAQGDLNGTLTFQNCGDVNVEHVQLKCASGASRAATCLTVNNSSGVSNRTGAPAARIRACTFEAGNLQIGILLVNVPRCEVEDNVLFAGAKPASLSIDRLILDPSFRAALRKRLIGNPQFALPSAPAPGTPTTQPPTVPIAAPAPGRLRASPLALNTSVQFGGNVLHFNTPDRLASEWQQILLAKPPAQNVSPRGLLKFLKNRVDELLVNPKLRATVPALNNFFNGLRGADRSVAFQGIVIAGQVARDIRVLNNTIEGVLQGIHIGVSHHIGPQDPLNTRTDIAGTVMIAGNTVEVVITQDAIRRERHGIFAGNCNSLCVENNSLTLTRTNATADIQVEGARLHGFLGRRVIFKHNHVTGFPIGVAMFPRFPYPKPGEVLWLIADNMFELTSTQVRVPPAPHAGAPITIQGNGATP